MIVGIDIDDTMTNHCSAWFRIYNENYKPENAEDLKLEDAYKWDFYDEWDKEQKDFLMYALNSGDPKYYDYLHLFPNVKEVILKILNSDNKVIIISATSKELQEAKKKWLLEQIPVLTEDDIIFTSNKSLINVDVMIDDNLAAAKDFKCPFLLYKEPWNTNRPPYEYSNNVVNVGSWKDIEEVLINLGIITVLTTSTDEIFSEATAKLIQDIKDAKTDRECMDILNPYIKLWQQQGVLIGMKQINDATAMVAEDILKDLSGKK